MAKKHTEFNPHLERHNSDNNKSNKVDRRKYKNCTFGDITENESPTPEEKPMPQEKVDGSLESLIEKLAQLDGEVVRLTSALENERYRNKLIQNVLDSCLCKDIDRGYYIKKEFPKRCYCYKCLEINPVKEAILEKKRSWYVCSCSPEHKIRASNIIFPELDEPRIKNEGGR